MPEIINGIIRKLVSEFSHPISYSLPLGDASVSLNPLIEKIISLKFLGEIYCIQCQRKTNKSFQQGYCYPCYQKLLDCNLCIIHPERCSYPDKACPSDWAHEHCSQPHIVYIANSSDFKVGITRQTNIPTRWIDQGAVQAIPFLTVSNRRDAGRVEVFLKQFLKDKTNWRKMLTQPDLSLDVSAKMLELKEAVHEYVTQHNSKYSQNPIKILQEIPVNIHYPITKFPDKLKSLALEKDAICATLLGIKGQYLIFDTGVINIRKYGGYKIEFSYQ